MPPSSPAKFTVYRDSSEKPGHGWVFEPSESCAGTEVKNLYTADYSVACGDVDFYEQKLLALERKGGVAEFVGNLTQKDKWDDFRQELERLDEFRWPFLVLEFDYDLLMSYPVGSGIPRARWSKIRVSPRFLQKRLQEIELRFKTRVVFVGAHGKEWAASLFRRVVEFAHADQAP